LNLRNWIRQGHRWLGLTLTLTILANFVAMAFGEPPPWIVFAPLAPLALLVISGMYMFFQPYLSRGGADGARASVPPR
jgi:heme A synthase